MTLDDIVRREFPRLLEGDTVWLNNASTGPLPERALELSGELVERRLMPWRYGTEEQFGALDACRAHCARLIGASPKEIALTVNTTAGINLAARALPLGPGDVVIGTDRDFPANAYPWMAAARDRGFTFRQVACRDGLFDEDAIVAALDTPGARALATSWVSFESGVRLDLDRLGAECRRRGITFIVDAMQGLGPLTLDVSRTPIDILVCGGQKWLLSPWGTGFAYLGKDLAARLEPINVSWMAVRGSEDFSRLVDYRLDYRDDARRFDAITLPYQDFAVMAASLALMHEIGPAAIAERVLERTTRLVAWAASRAEMRLVTPAAPHRRAGIVSIAPPDPVAMSSRLNAGGIAHSLREGAIRLAPYFFTPAEHVERAIDVLSR
ncbi:MAG: aminotransferase class V-fold PLP-dependent enzyme [Gemmatimonadaceae bacterium]|nr:aminotransferase class V-fold PLP-dependent enzyme [Gemmatimonadaceae bacterium]